MIRYLCSELVHITSLDGPHRQVQCGNLEEIGAYFAEILTERPFPRQASVCITSKTHRMDGSVESCELQQPLGYFVRVKLALSAPWSEQRFTPKHLLRIQCPQPKVSHVGVASGY